MLIFRLLRSSHWVKNLYVFAPLFFGGHFLVKTELVNSTITFLLFSLAASSIYILNDIKDIREDRIHPQKKTRPIASGQISIRAARLIMAFLAITTLILTILFDFQVFVIIASYLLLNVLYTYSLKHIPIVDISVIALGFVLRILAGGLATGIILSHWLLIMVYLLSLFLAIAKRRDDLVLIDANITSSEVRKSISGYNLDFINAAISVLSALIIVCYIMYITSQEVLDRLNFPHAYFTLTFVLSGILRYLQLTLVDKKSASPTDVLIKDRFIQITVLLWILSFTYILYFN